MKQATFRVGDIVSLDKPTTPVKRVGYRLHVDEVDYASDPELKAFAKSIPLHWHKSVRAAILHELNRQYVYSREFGGRERMVIRDDNPTGEPLPAGLYKVTEKKVKYTGVYKPASNADYVYGCEYDPATLWGKKPVHLLTIFQVGGDRLCPEWGVVTADDVSVPQEVTQ